MEVPADQFWVLHWLWYRSPWFFFLWSSLPQTSSPKLKDDIVHRNDSLRILPRHACQVPMTRHRGQLDYYILSLPLSIKPNAIRNTWLHQHISFNQMWLSQSLVFFSRQIKNTSACIINVTASLLKWFVKKEAPLEENLRLSVVLVLFLLAFITIKHPRFVCSIPSSLFPSQSPCCQAEFGLSLIRMISLSHCYHYDLGN